MHKYSLWGFQEINRHLSKNIFRGKNIVAKRTHSCLSVMDGVFRYVFVEVSTKRITRLNFFVFLIRIRSFVVIILVVWVLNIDFDCVICVL